jgi:hypothetical protein
VAVFEYIGTERQRKARELPLNTNDFGGGSSCECHKKYK